LPLDEFFEEFRDRERIVAPFELSSSLLKFNTWAVVEGGGKSSKSDAIATAVARGLVVHGGALADVLDNGIFY
jgi:small subunit ribosomal protein S9